MSVHVTSAVWRESQADGSGLLILLSLADQADDDGWCWPSVASIARRCRRSERAVQDQLSALVGSHDEVTGEPHGMFELERQVRPGRSTVYRVLFGWEGAKQAREEARAGGADSAPVQAESRGAKSAPPQNLHPADPAPGGAVDRTGGVRSTAPRNVRETSLNQQGAQKRAHRLPDDWQPTSEHLGRLRTRRPDVDLQLETEMFRAHWHSSGGQAARKHDWDLAFTKWVLGARSAPGKPAAGYHQTDEQIRQERLARAGDLTPPARLGGDPAAERAWLRAARQRIADGLPLDDIGDAA